MLSSTSKDGLHTIEFDEAKHHYKLDGKRVPGATTVGACYPKGEGLIRWLIQQGIEAYDSKEALTRSGSIGSLVHRYIYCIETGEPFDPDELYSHPDRDAVERCIQRFEAWKSGNEDKVLRSEFLVGSASLRLGGMVDTLRQRGEVVIVGDWKTARRIYISALHQAALYRLMLREWEGVEAGAIEILKFGKTNDDEPFETAYVDNKGLLVNGSFYEEHGLLDEIEQQAVRNVHTYRHAQSAENLLLRHYEEQKRRQNDA